MNVGLVITGNAKYMSFDDLRDEKITIPYGHACFKTFREKCGGEGGICSGADNCIVNPIILTPNGYVYTQDLCAYAAIGDNDYSYATGNILEQSLYAIIDNIKTQDAKPMCAVYRDVHDMAWQVRRLMYHYILVREGLLRAITKVDLTIYADAIELFVALRGYYKEAITFLKNGNDRVNLNTIFAIIQDDYDQLLKMAKLIFKSNVNEQERLVKQIPCFLERQDSFFFPEKFSQKVFPYEKFKKLWEYYYAADFENFKILNIDLDKSLKLEGLNI